MRAMVSVVLGLSLLVPAGAGRAGPAIALDGVRSLDGGQFLVGPRWSPDGRWLLASGRGGQGLFRLPAAGGRAEVVDEAFRGQAGWTPDGRVSEIRPARDETGREWIPTGAGMLLFEEYTGRLSLLALFGARLLAVGAWDVRPSPDGRRVAYCLGHLIAPTLVIEDLAAGESLRLVGAHPAWAPDGSGLVYAEPVGAPERTDDAPFASSVLVWWSAADGSRTALWSEGLPFQPAFSPDGSQLAWSDWASGRLLLGRLLGREVRP